MQADLVSVFGSLLPLAVIVLLIVGGVWLSKRRSKAPTADLTGPHGWLGFFIGCAFVLSPLYGVGSLFNEFGAAESQYPNLVNVPAWKTYKAGVWLVLAAVVVWQWWVANTLRTSFIPSSVSIVKTFLVVAPLAMGVGIAMASYFAFEQVDGGSFVQVVLKGWASGVIWFIYFSVSRRVKNTYLRGQQDAAAAVEVPRQDAT